MYWFCNKNKGAVSVFLTLILLPVLLFGGIVVDGTRIIGAKNIVSGAGELAMNAALSNYDTALKDAYGLIAMSNSDEELSMNLQKYFEETINASGISQEDINRSLIYLEVMNSSDFVAKPVAKSQIYQTEIMKQQVIEYMKYRAPAILVKRGILDNIAQFQDVDAQKQSVQKQMDFENKLDKLQTDFDEINDLIEKHKESFRAISISDINTRLQKVKDIYNNRISLLSIAAEKLEDMSESESGDTYNQMERFLDKASGLSANFEESQAASTFDQLYSMKKISNGINNPNKILDHIEEESAEYEEREKMIEEYESEVSHMEAVIDEIRPLVQKLTEETYGLLNVVYERVCEEILNCERILVVVQEIRNKLSSLNEDYLIWGKSIETVKSEEVKGELEKNHEDYKALFDDQKDLEFEEKISNNTEYYKQLKAELESFTFCDKKIVETKRADSFYANAASYASEATSKSSLTSQKNSFMQAEWSKAVSGSLKYAVNITAERKTLDNDAFVEKVKEYVDKKDDNTEKSEKDAKKMDNELKKDLEAYKHLLLSDDVPAINVEQEFSDLPSQWLTTGNSESKAEEELAIDSSMNDKKGREDIKDSATQIMDRDNSAMEDLSSLLKKVEGAAVEGASNVYITEYIMDMFSYYTVNQSEGADIIPAPTSISGMDFSENKMYRAEVEYILWGDPILKNNVRNTKAMIFTIQMVGNTIFAFTNKELKNEAKLIASLFPVGPLSKAAIRAAILAVCSLVETVEDLKQMMEGDAIPLYKKVDASKKSTWETWPLKLLTGTKSESREVGPQDMALTYRDYLWLFVCINTLGATKERNLLARTANCIEINTEDSIKNNYTMIQIQAEVNIDTFFMQKVGEGTYRIPYKGIQGY